MYACMYIGPRWAGGEVVGRKSASLLGEDGQLDGDKMSTEHTKYTGPNIANTKPEYNSRA